MRDKILEQFIKLTCIKDHNALIHYVDFCFENNLVNKIKNVSSTHHILPMAKTLPFRQFSDLSIHIWNKSELTYYNHYLAHYFLTLAIDHIAIHVSFCGMHNKDYAKRKISNDELILPDEYKKIYQKRNELISNHRKEIINIDGILMTRAKFYNTKIDYLKSKSARSERMSGNNNIVHIQGVIDKIRHSKLTTYIDGVNLDKISAIRAAETMKKLYIDEFGNQTTTYEQSGKKISDTITKEYIDNHGNITTIAKEKGKIHSRILRNKGKWFLLKNIFAKNFECKLSAIEIRQISPGLETKTENDYLGKSQYGITVLTKKGKSHLIGLFVEKL
jgi:hypothetical protein